MDGSDDLMQCGYIKAKFLLDGQQPLFLHESYQWCCENGRPRVTDFFVYIAFGHKTIPDNKTARKYISAIQQFGGKITRLDFCVDYLGTLDFDAFYSLHDNDKKPTPSILKSPVGCTVYVGKRSSARMLRVYDKTNEILAKERVDIGFPITRIELEVKRNMISRYTALFMSGKTEVILSDIQRLYGLRGFCESHTAVKPTHNRDKEGSEWRFVTRFRRVIKEAYTMDKTKFFRILEVNNERTS